MNFFLDQNRCGVCGRIFCCIKHQKQHEKLEHEEFLKWLDILPICCRTCGKRVSTIHELNSKCIVFNKRHCFVEGCLSGTPKLSRKRRLDENIFKKSISDENLRKRIEPFYKHFTKPDAINSPNLLMFDLNGVKNEKLLKIGDPAINAIISPDLNVSYKILKSDAKSSTPLNEDKENITVVSISVKQDATEYCTPENLTGSSLILVSALKKKLTSPSCTNRKSSDGRRVTFDTVSPSGETSVYGTPMVTLSADSASEATFTHQMVILSPPVDENVESGVPTINDFSNEAGEHRFAKIARNMRLTLNGIPRSLSSMWEWTQRRIRRKKQRDEFDSPISKRNKMKATLKRRPIFSYWVNMSITSMVRDPLPNYKEKYSRFKEPE